MQEIDQLFAYKNIETTLTSKEDIRHQLLSYHVVTSNIAAMGGKKAISGINVKTFAFEWGKSKGTMSAEDIISGFKALEGVWRKQGNK